MRTRLSICERKVSFASEDEARSAADRFGLELRTYRCDRCRAVHLTSRTRGKRVPRAALEASRRHTVELAHAT